MKVLYICTHNRCRSILSEAITNHIGAGVIQAKSAGSQPSGEVHPSSIRFLELADYSTNDLTSKSWDDLADFEPDVIFTVCDAAAGEACPLWFGQSLKLHWGLADPSKLTGSEEDIAQAFNTCIQTIERRVEQLVDIAKLAPSEWKHALQNMQGVS